MKGGIKSGLYDDIEREVSGAVVGVYNNGFHSLRSPPPPPNLTIPPPTPPSPAQVRYIPSPGRLDTGIYDTPTYGGCPRG